MSDYTIGLDVSTQAAKAVACDAEGRILARSCKPYPEPFRPVDDPATLVGCGAERPGTAIVSLGTSDVFMSAVEPDVRPPGGLGHVFGNPTGKLMALVCVKNGSLARDCVRRELGVDWKFFDETAWMNEGRDARRGESRKTAFPFFEEEITPPHPATGVEANFDWQNASSDEKVRAIVRGQVANLREHTRWTGDFSRIMVVGGASRSEGICRTIAEVFGADVVPADDADAAARGAALLAWRRFSS